MLSVLSPTNSSRVALRTSGRGAGRLAMRVVRLLPKQTVKTLHDGIAFWAALSLWMGGLRAKELPNKGSEICQLVHLSERGSRL